MLYIWLLKSYLTLCYYIIVSFFFFQITPDLDANHGFQLISRGLDDYVDFGFQPRRRQNDIRFTGFDHLEEGTRYFFKLPDKFIGNRV